MNERQGILLNRTIDRCCARASWYAYAARRFQAFSLVFTPFWHFFFTANIRITLGSSSIIAPLLWAIFHGRGACGVSVTLLTTSVWTRNARSFGSDCRLLSSHRLARTVLNAGFLPSSWWRQRRNRSRLLFRTTFTSSGSRVITCRHCRMRSSSHLAVRVR